VFKVLAAIPDERQMERISFMMIGSDKRDNGVLGLMTYGEDVNRRYANEYHYSNCIGRYDDLIRDLQRQRVVADWMLDNRRHWAWMEPEVRPQQVQQSRGDYSGRRDGGVAQHSHMPPNNSDSDVNATMNFSDDDALDDDDDSRYEGGKNAVDFIFVAGSGIPEINGEYCRSGSCDNVSKYKKSGKWDGKDEEFILFRCKLSDGTRRWYISIVPGNHHPGTTNDVDFYVSPTDGISNMPPKIGWKATGEGSEPAPTVSLSSDDGPDETEGQVDSDVVFETDGGTTEYL